MKEKRLSAYAAIKDSEFIRGNVPMTKEEIRTVSFSKLGITGESVLYDIGAGTGSVSVTAALCCPEARVYAFERNPEALELIGQNIGKFSARNIEVIAGDALERLRTAEAARDGLTLAEQIPAPTHVFVGGSGGRLREIVGAVRVKNARARFVVNAVTLETLENCLALAEE